MKVARVIRQTWLHASFGPGTLASLSPPPGPLPLRSSERLRGEWNLACRLLPRHPHLGVITIAALPGTFRLRLARALVKRGRCPRTVRSRSLLAVSCVSVPLNQNKVETAEPVARKNNRKALRVRHRRCDEMADIADLKSAGRFLPCGFESRHRQCWSGKARGCEKKARAKSVIRSIPKVPQTFLPK